MVHKQLINIDCTLSIYYFFFIATVTLSVGDNNLIQLYIYLHNFTVRHVALLLYIVKCLGKLMQNFCIKGTTSTCDCGIANNRTLLFVNWVARWRLKVR